MMQSPIHHDAWLVGGTIVGAIACHFTHAAMMAIECDVDAQGNAIVYPDRGGACGLE